MKAFVELAAWIFVAFLVAPCIVYALARLFRCVKGSALGRQTRAVVLVFAVVATIATIKAQKRGGTGTTGVPPVESGTTGTTGILPVANPVTDTLHFSSISVPTSGTVTLTVAWPENFFVAGQMLDVLGKESLRDVSWTWITNDIITAEATNISWTLESQSPSNHFYKVVLRDSLTDMDDPDGDGMPNVYELANGTNPFVSDYASAPKIVAGGSGADSVADLASAFATSGEYSIIEVAPGIHSGSGWTGLHLPAYPVMITSSDGGRSRTATLRHVAQMAAFYLSATQRTDTVVQGLNIDLVASDGQQMGFWCGGNLPWSGPPAAGTFRNISMRMPNPGVQYFGWFFRHWESNEVVIAASTINASGATNVRGVYAMDSPPMSVENCTFANFPPAGGGTLGYGIQYESTPANWGNAPDVIPIEIVNCLFDVSFMNAHALAPLEQGVSYDVTMWNCIVPSPLMYLPDHEYGTIVTNALTAWSGHLLADSPAIGAGMDVLHSSYDLDGQPRDECPDIGADEYAPDVMGDADGDGLSDSYEIENGIDPYRADSDFDGVDDAREITDETNPIDPHSFTQTLTVTVTNTASTACTVYTAWGYSADGWETNEQKTFPNGFGVTNYTNASSQGATHVKAYCDLDGNGEYDPANDILLARAIPQGSTAQIDFTFGDVDGDVVSDAQERVDGTDPYDGGNFRLFMTVNFVPCGTALWLTNYVAYGYSQNGWETNGLTFFTGTNLLFSIDETLTNGMLYAKVFRDLNTNGVYDAEMDEFVSRRLTSADIGKTVTLQFGDSNHNDLPDWWEDLTGLSAVTNGGAYVDTDCDGLINLHEFWASCNPLVPDGSNTLLSAVSRAVDDGISGRDPTNAICKFINYEMNGVNGIFVPNTNFWAFGIDTSCASMWNDAGYDAWGGACNGWNLAGTLISARHIIYAHHYAIPHGTTLYFIDTSGNVYSRTLINSRYIACDVCIGLLNSDLPPAVHPAKFLPSNYGDYILTAKGLPCVTFDQEEKLIVADLYDLRSHNERFSLSSAQRPHSNIRQLFYEDMIGGDSGNPRFLLVDHELVLLCVMWWGGGGSGCFITHFIDEIQAAMNSLIDGYQIQFIELEAFQRLPNKMVIGDTLP